MSAHDTWLANYRHTVEQMWCENPKCDNHQSSITVDYEEEYGQGWTQPEECPICHGPLTFDAPSDAT